MDTQEPNTTPSDGPEPPQQPPQSNSNPLSDDYVSPDSELPLNLHRYLSGEDRDALQTMGLIVDNRLDFPDDVVEDLKSQMAAIMRDSLSEKHKIQAANLIAKTMISMAKLRLETTKLGLEVVSKANAAREQKKHNDAKPVALHAVHDVLESFMRGDDES